MKSVAFVMLLSGGILLTGCSSGGDAEEPMQEVDAINPTISCIDDINDVVDATSSGKVITYDAPEGSDNMPGAETTQTAGLASGEEFPVGTTVNTYEVRDAAGNVASCSFNVTITRNEPSSDAPFFIGSNPAPDGAAWVRVASLSDEFDDDSFDDTKWINTDARRWIGRPPGLFVENTVSEVEGNLRLTAYQFDAPQTVNGNEFTHAGSNIYSRASAQVGDYFEARMRASQTFMSSTFWLINDRNEGTGCDIRVTELDIQECVGQVTGTANFAQTFDATIHSNTHSRQAECPETPTGSAGNNAEIGAKVFEDYHVYGAWWKGPREIEFYLDGELVYTIVPEGDFDLPLYLRMVVETYDWNPVPADGGMTGTEDERTTYFDWVRTWRLE